MNMQIFIYFLYSVLGIALFLYACIDSVPDNHRGAAFWPLLPGGWYGSVLFPGFVFKLPFAKIVTYSIATRKAQKKYDIFYTEPKTGFIVKTEQTILVWFDKETRELDDFVKFHQVQDGLEEDVWEYVKNFVDNLLRHADEPTSDSAKTDEIVGEAVAEAKKFIKEYSGAGRLALAENWLKIDIDDEARRAVQAAKIQEKYNEQQQLAQDKFDAMVKQQMGGTEEAPDMTKKEATIAVLNRMDQTSNLSDTTFNIPGLKEAMVEIGTKLLAGGNS